MSESWERIQDTHLRNNQKNSAVEKRNETEGKAQTDPARWRVSVRQRQEDAGWWQVCEEEEEDGSEEQT